MHEQHFQFTYQVYNNSDELADADRMLLQAAREATQKSYAPYSHFHVGAAARMANGNIISGANQENAAYPNALCAERVLLAALSAVHSQMVVESMAVSYNGEGQESNQPISPCGMCRQSLQEFEDRTGKPLRLILAGMSGPVFVVERASQLLPLAFTSGVLI